MSIASTNLSAVFTALNMYVLNIYLQQFHLASKGSVACPISDLIGFSKLKHQMDNFNPKHIAKVWEKPIMISQAS